MLNPAEAVGTTDYTDGTDEKDDGLEILLTRWVTIIATAFLVQTPISVLSVQSVVSSVCSS
jgi:hypothetical protein